MKVNKKALILTLVVFLLLFTPIPTGIMKDGGTRVYSALTYKIVRWSRITENGIYKKLSVYPLPMCYFDIDELWEIEQAE